MILVQDYDCHDINSSIQLRVSSCQLKISILQLSSYDNKISYKILLTLYIDLSEKSFLIVT